MLHSIRSAEPSSIAVRDRRSLLAKFQTFSSPTLSTVSIIAMARILVSDSLSVKCVELSILYPSGTYYQYGLAPTTSSSVPVPVPYRTTFTIFEFKRGSIEDSSERTRTSTVQVMRYPSRPFVVDKGQIIRISWR